MEKQQEAMKKQEQQKATTPPQLSHIAQENSLFWPVLAGPGPEPAITTGCRPSAEHPENKSSSEKTLAQ